MDTPRHALAAASLASLWPSSALAFSGAYVGAQGDQPVNRESRAVMARAGQATTLTLFNDVRAGERVFGLVVPVPVEIDSGNVRTLDPAVMHGVEAYSAPRASTTSCEQLYFAQAPPPSEPLDLSCSFSSGEEHDELWFDTGANDLSWEDQATGVTIEDRFTVGEYEAFVLQGSTGTGLEQWLSQEGLSLPPGADQVLDDYIADGHYFLALRVVLEEIPTDETWLTPVQIGYLAAEWTLPLRLGTLSSGGVQDLVLMLLTDADMGQVGIGNYGPESPIPSDCLLSDPAEMDQVYGELLAHSLGLPAQPEQLDGAQGLAWAVEHRWTDGQCEPCTEHGPLSRSDAEALGLPDGAEDYVLTRLRLRYTPQAMVEDPELVADGGRVEPVQMRYYVGSWEIAGEFEPCMGAPMADVGICYSASWMAYRESLPTSEQPPLVIDDKDGCKHHRGLIVLGLPALFGLARRRRT